MSKNRVTFHRGKGYAKHNEHKYMNEDERNVICERYVGDEFDDFYTAELSYYAERYTPWLNMQNEKHIEARNYKRVKTIKDIYKNKNYEPTETIGQYGSLFTDLKDLPPDDEFLEMVKEYVDCIRYWSSKHGNHCVILDWAVHFDESTPHVQIREVWEYVDEDGIVKIGKDKGMEQAGIPLPDPNEKKGRFNNRQMTFTKECRETWQDICERHGYAVERTPRDKDIQKHFDKRTFVRQKYAEMNEAKRQADEIIKNRDDIYKMAKKDGYMVGYEQGKKKLGQKVIREVEKKGSKIQNNNPGFDLNLYH